jgi:hypothetical protein
VRTARVLPGEPVPAGLVGAVLTRDLVIDGERWSKGRRLSAADLERLAGATSVASPGLARRTGPVTLLVPESGDVHEDEAARRLASAVAGPGVSLAGPVESRIDLRAAAPGVVRVRTAALERLNRIDPLEVFTVFDGVVVEAGDLVASVKVAPHLVPERVLEAALALTRGGRRPIVAVRPFRRRRVAALVKESIEGPARARFEATVRAKVEGLGSELVAVRYVADEPEAIRAALAELAATTLAARAGAPPVDLVLTAGGASTDPLDPLFLALEAAGGTVVRRGVPAHPGSMLWLGRLHRTTLLGLPTCGAYSKATAADLLLAWLLAGEPPTTATVARLGHGGILTRDQRFRFPAYARALEAPEG